MKRWQRTIPLIAFTGWQRLFGGLILLPLLFVSEGLPATLSPENLAGFLYLGAAVTLGGYLLWFWGIERLPAFGVASLVFISPAIAFILDYVFTGVSITGIQALGLCLIVVSVIGALRTIGRANQNRRFPISIEREMNR